MSLSVRRGSYFCCLIWENVLLSSQIIILYTWKKIINLDQVHNYTASQADLPVLWSSELPPAVYNWNVLKVCGSCSSGPWCVRSSDVQCVSRADEALAPTPVVQINKKTNQKVVNICESVRRNIDDSLSFTSNHLSKHFNTVFRDDVSKLLCSVLLHLYLKFTL